MNINYEINRLISFGLQHHMIEEADLLYAANKIIDILRVPSFEYEAVELPSMENPSEILGAILDYAASNGVLECDSVDHRDLLDTKIDYFVRLNFSTLTKSIDLLDGIDVYSDREFTPWTNKNITIQKGMNHMDGETALAFARERHAYESGDRHRGENQQEIITAMINKMTDKNYITKYKDILTSLDGSFETSMRYEEMTNLFKMQINNNIKWNITSISLDGTGSMQHIVWEIGSFMLWFQMIIQ